MKERLIRIRVEADAREDCVVEEKEGRLLICVREPAAENRANLRALQLLARHVHVPPESLRIVAGHHKPTKTIRILGE